MSINSLLSVVIVVPLYKCGDGTGLGAGGEKAVTTLGIVGRIPVVHNMVQAYPYRVCS